MAKKQPKITVIERDISDLIFAEYNPRQMTADQKQHLTDSMKRFGFVDPIIINTHEKRSNVIIGGHQRVRIAKELGITSIPCVELSLDINEEKELNIRLNKNTGEWDFDALANYFEVSDLIEWGFDEKELNFDVEAQEGLTDEDAIPEVTEPTCKPGDLWILGDHRLLCGDATSIDAVDKLMGGEKADMVFTDPPYDLDDHDYADIINSFSENAHVFLMHDDRGIVGYLRRSTLDFQRFFVANFQFSSPRGNDPYLQHILLSHEKNGDAIKHQIKHDGFSSIIKLEYRHRLKDDKTDHKHQKPIEFISKFIEHYTEENKTNILDIFLGSGSTLIACEKTNRKCYGMELDPHYCDVIIKRWEDYTGKKAELYAVTEG